MTDASDSSTRAYVRKLEAGGETEKRLLDALATGAPVTLACAHAGIHRDTFYAARKEDPEFGQRAEAARAAGALRNLAYLNQAAQTDWRAAATALQLTYPEHFGKQRVEVSGPDEGPVRIAPEVSPDFVADVLRRLSETSGSPTPEDPI